MFDFSLSSTNEFNSERKCRTRDFRFPWNGRAHAQTTMFRRQRIRSRHVGTGATLRVSRETAIGCCQLPSPAASAAAAATSASDVTAISSATSSQRRCCWKSSLGSIRTSLSSSSRGADEASKRRSSIYSPFPVARTTGSVQRHLTKK